MKAPFQTVALIGRYQTPGSRELLEALAAYVQARGLQVVLEADTAVNTGLTAFETLDVHGIGQRCDVAIVAGGDGTMLHIARVLARHGVPLIGINQGRLGFITDISAKSYEELLGPMLAGDYVEDRRAMIQGEVHRGDQLIFEAVALNDVVVSRGATASMVELKVEVDGEFVANQRADGLIISSPTGSTAYSLSAGGPIMHPGVGGWALVPIAPHTLSNRPVVLPDSCTITVEIIGGRDASANFDMQSLAHMQHGDRITVRRAKDQVRFLHPRGWSYFMQLRKKLHWNEGAGAAP